MRPYDDDDDLRLRARAPFRPGSDLGCRRGTTIAAWDLLVRPRASNSPPRLPPGSFLTHSVGFGGYVGSTSLSEAYADLAVSETDSDAGRALRRLLKPNPATKLKALAEISEIVSGFVAADDPGSVAALIPRWTVAYRRLFSDDDPSVRAEAHGVNGAVAAGAGRGLGKHLRALAPSWFLGACDRSNREAREAAREAFERVFATPEKRAAALKMAAEDVLTRVEDILRKNGREAEEVDRGCRREDPVQVLVVEAPGVGSSGDRWRDGLWLGLAAGRHRAAEDHVGEEGRQAGGLPPSGAYLER